MKYVAHNINPYQNSRKICKTVNFSKFIVFDIDVNYDNFALI